MAATLEPRPPAPLSLSRNGWPWRLALLLIALLLGLIGFTSGVGVSERDSVRGAGILAHLYYTLGLFIFGGMDLGTPVGGPLYGRIALWGAYFLAPLITITAVVEALILFVGTDRIRRNRLSDHIVVVGTERLTHLFLRRLRDEAPKKAVIVLGAPEQAAQLEDLRERFRVHILVGRPTSRVALRRLRLDRASRILVLNRDDFLNFDTATRMLELCPRVAPHLTVHVRDLVFLRSIRSLRLPVLTNVFNGHARAASYLVEELLVAHFHETEQTDVVVLAGFGSFGQTVLHQLQELAEGQFDHVLILDNEASLHTATFEDQVGFSDSYTREAFDGDIRFPEVWAPIRKRFDEWGGEPVIIVGSGDDQANVRVALTLAERYPSAVVIARNEKQWSFADALAKEAPI
ncbi:MAG: NAD-binding protein, partial [Myxococcota bacterium]